jgi:hypothetical protein
MEKLTEIDDLMGEISDGLQEYLQNADGVAGKIKVYRRPDKGDARRVVWLFDASPDELTHSELLEKLRDEYDGGEFVVRIYADDGKTFITSQRVAVGAPVKRDAAPAPVAPANPMHDPLFLMMREQAAQQQTMLMQLMAAIAGRPAPVMPEGLSVADALALADRMQRNSAPPDPMQYIMQGIELGKIAAGNAGEGEGGFMSALSALAPAIAAMAQSQQTAPQPRQEIAPQPRQLPHQPRQLPHQPRQAPPVVTPEPRQDAAPIAPIYSGVAEFMAAAGAAVTLADVQEWHETVWPVLRVAAMKNKPTEPYAEMVIAAVGEDTAAAVLLATDSVTEQQFTELVTAYGAGNYAPWLWALYQAINTQFSPEAGDDLPHPDDSEGGLPD